MPAVTENGILMYGLAGNWCEECGRAKSFRLFPGTLTGCKTCDEVVTRHRCTKRPDLDPGQSWECPDCGSLWTAREEEETCESCGQGIGTMRKRWDSVAGGRIDSAPRHEPLSFTPFRNALRKTADALITLPFRYQKPSLGSCYQMASGPTVHVKPGCRCKR